MAKHTTSRHPAAPRTARSASRKITRSARRTGEAAAERAGIGASDSEHSPEGLERRVLALAEQLGRAVGTVQVQADRLVDRKALSAQLARVRDGASQLISSLGRQRTPPRPVRAPRSGGVVDAPGKTHRPRPASARGVKKSDQMVAKARASETMRRVRRTTSR
jgi:hypothetical protein